MFKVAKQMVQVDSSEALRSLLCASTDDFQQSLRFQRLERITLAYHLAEFTLLMLSTKWLSGLCSCTIIRHICQQKDSPAYSFRAGQAQHLEPGTAFVLDGCKQWCEQDLKEMPIRRCGLLLLEIGLGKTIDDAGFNPVTTGR
jgi:hypothetical protein